MAYTLTHGQDFDDVWGRHRVQHYLLNPALSDYVAGGYLIQGEAGTTESTGNVGMAKVGYVIPIGGQGGYSPVWNPTTSKLQMFEPSNAYGPAAEVAASTNLNAYQFNLLVVGY